METVNNSQQSSPISLSQEFCFKSNGKGICLVQQALDYYEKNKNSYDDWLFKSDIPIFLDTNILLDLYEISLKEREQFLKFLEKNKKRIYLTGQIDKEYLKHRIPQINGFKKTLKKLITDQQEFIDGVQNCFGKEFRKLQDYAKRKILIDDMPESAELLNKIIKHIEDCKVSEEKKKQFTDLVQVFQDKLREQISFLIKSVELEHKDPILKVIATLQILDPMPDSDKDFLKKLYDELLSIYNEHKNNVEQKDLYSFPGCGDRKKMKDGFEPYGDFYIYHELLLFMNEKQVDVIFLTKDVTKSDWIKEDKRPFVHYVVNTFELTNKMMYIISSNDFIPLSFASLAEYGDNTVDDDISELEECSNSLLLRSESQGESTISVNDESLNLITTSSYLREITRERFIKELETSLKWSEQYGDGYVGMEYFIYSILKYKHFRYDSSRKMLDNLIEEGIIEKDVVERDGKKIDSIKFIKKNHRSKK